MAKQVDRGWISETSKTRHGDSAEMSTKEPDLFEDTASGGRGRGVGEEMPACIAEWQLPSEPRAAIPTLHPYSAFSSALILALAAASGLLMPSKRALLIPRRRETVRVLQKLGLALEFATITGGALPLLMLLLCVVVMVEMLMCVLEHNSGYPLQELADRSIVTRSWRMTQAVSLAVCAAFISEDWFAKLIFVLIVIFRSLSRPLSCQHR